MSVGRPETYDYELCKEICLELYNYTNLSEVLKTDDRFPARSTFFKWKREQPELSDLYVKIQQDKGELFVEEIDQTIQDLKEGKLEASAANVIIQSLKWKAAKYYPKMFGDSTKIDHTISEGVKEIKIVLDEAPKKSD